MHHWLVKLVFNLIGGLGLFLFGMHLMSDGLKRAAGDRLRNIIRLLTRNVVSAIFVGCGVTCLIQSSSATSVMVIGFVNAGLLSLRQAIATIMGADIGTTITAWLVALVAFLKDTKIDIYALPMIGIGFLIFFLCRLRRTRMAGQVILGLGLLVLGLGFMQEAFPLRSALAKERARAAVARRLESRAAGTEAEGEVTEEAAPTEPAEKMSEGEQVFFDSVVRAFRVLGKNPILGVLVGALVTMIVQSSSMTIALVQMMAVAGMLDLNSAMALVLGENIGTTITAQIAALGSDLPARRAARAHALIKITGTAYFLPLIYFGVCRQVVLWIGPNLTMPMQIAIFHTGFNIVNIACLAPMIGLIERLVKTLFRGRHEEPDGTPMHLESRLLDTPGVALDGARREIVRMTEIAREAVSLAVKGLLNRDRRVVEAVARREEATDNLQREITRYLVEISRRNLGQEEAETFPVLVHTVNDIERVGDHAENIAELAERSISEQLSFSQLAREEMQQFWDELQGMFDDTLIGLRDPDGDEEAPRRALKCEERINQLENLYRQTHAQRLTEGACTIPAGLIFIELIANLEKIADHLTNVNEALLGSFRYNQVPNE